MTFDDFIGKYNDQGVDTDGAYGYQCMDLMHKYNQDVFGLPLSVLAAPTAYQAYVNGDSHFDKIDNTPTGIPTKGDIIFWKPNVSGVTGSAGHVAIYLNGDVNGFNSFDQNYPTGTKSHLQGHNYNGVAGWLHFKAPVDLQKQLDDMRKQRDDNWNKFIAEQTKNQELNAKFLQLMNQLDKRDKQIQDILNIIK